MRAGSIIPRAGPKNALVGEVTTAADHHQRCEISGGATRQGSALPTGKLVR